MQLKTVSGGSEPRGGVEGSLVGRRPNLRCKGFDQEPALPVHQSNFLHHVPGKKFLVGRSSDTRGHVLVICMSVSWILTSSQHPWRASLDVFDAGNAHTLIHVCKQSLHSIACTRLAGYTKTIDPRPTD